MPSLVEKDPMVLGKKIFKISSMYFRCRYHLPLEKGVALHLNKFESFTQECFVPSLVEIGLVVLENKIFKFDQCIFAIL